MDADNIIPIIIWGVVIIVSWIASSVKKQKEQNGAADLARNHARRQAQHRREQSAPKQPQETGDQILATVMALQAKAAATQAKGHQPVVTRKKGAEPQPMLQTNEGERVTKAKPMQPAQRQKPAAALRQADPLSNREKLRQALIYGEILAPKF